MRLLNDGHQVWSAGSHRTMAKVLKEMTDSAKIFEQQGFFVLGVTTSTFEDVDGFFYTGTVVVDTSYPLPVP